MSYFLDQQTVDFLGSDATDLTLRSTGGQNLGAAWEETWRNNTLVSDREGEIEVTGEQYERARKMGLDLPRQPDSPELIRRLPSDPRYEQERQALRRAYDDQVREINSLLPENEKKLLTLDEIRHEAGKRARLAREKFADISARGDFGGDVAAFVGAGAASMLDPANLFVSVAVAPAAGANLFRAFGTGLLSRTAGFAAVEGAANMGAEAAIQTHVVPWLMETGMSRNEAMAQARANVVMAGLFGATLGAGIPLAAAAARRIRRAFRSGDAAKIEEAIQDTLRRERDGLPEDLRAAHETLDDVADVERSLPPGAARDGVAVADHAATIDAAVAAIREGRVPPTRYYDGAHTRILPARRIEIGPEDAHVRLEIGEPVLFTRELEILDRLRALEEVKTRPAGFRVPPDYKPDAGEIGFAAEVRSGKPKGEARRPETLIDFLRARGGLDDTDPAFAELKAAGVTRMSRSRIDNQGRISRGLKMDYAREAAADAGFLPEGSTVRDLQDAVVRDFDVKAGRGGRPVVRAEDLPILEARAALAEIRQDLEGLGVPVDKLSARELAYVLAQDPATRERLALARVAERLPEVLDDAQSLTRALALSEELQAARTAELDLAIEAQARRREGFEDDLEADPDLVVRQRTEAALRLEDLEALHAELRAAEEGGRASARDPGPRRPGDRDARPVDERPAPDRGADRGRGEDPGGGSGSRSAGGDTGDQLRQLAAHALAERDPKGSVDLGKVGADVAAIARAGAVDLDPNLTFTVAARDLRHALLRTERSGRARPHPADLPVTADDIARLPEILSHPDAIRPGRRPTAQGRTQTIRFVKRDGDIFTVVEEVRPRSGALAFKTMWKRRAGDGIGEGEPPASPGTMPRATEGGGTPQRERPERTTAGGSVANVGARIARINQDPRTTAARIHNVIRRAAEKPRETATGVEVRAKAAGDLERQANAVREDLDARLADGRLDLDRVEIGTPDGKTMTARAFLERSKEREAGMEAFLGCLGGAGGAS